MLSAALLASALLSRPARAQGGAAATPCIGQRINYIDIRPSAPTVSGMQRIPVAARVVRNLHVTTRASVIRRLLLLQQGDACDELRRAESERILRAQPYLAEATVRVVPSDFGGVNLEVETSDEIALVLSGSVTSSVPFVRAVRLGSANVSGSGVYFAADWRDGGVYRDGVAARFVETQLFGHPYQLSADGSRNPLGSNWEFESVHPFLTDLQRIAWLTQWGAVDDYAQLTTPDGDEHGLHITRRYADVGGLVRIGPPGRLSLLGGSLTTNDERASSTAVLVTDEGLRPDSGSLLLHRYTSHQVTRANLLWGVRNIGFVQVRGFDALNARQDLPVGFQLGTMVGRSLEMLGSRESDMFLAGDLYAGAASPTAAFRIQAQGEGRRSYDTDQWDGLFGTVRAEQYAKLSPTNTFTTSLEWSGIKRQRLPFALTLGDPVGGMRGYGATSTPAAQRAVLRLEDRVLLGRVLNLGELGFAGFVDSGRLWAGDVPYGVTTGMLTSIGVSLLGAVPPGSARLWRLDAAVGLNRLTGSRRFEIQLVGLDKTQFFFREPHDVENLREPTVPSSVFRWP